MATLKVGDVVQTRDGRKARIICDDRKNERPLIALIDDPDVGETGDYYYADGRAHKDGSTRSYDIVPAPRKRTVWINMYGETEAIFGTRAQADRSDAMHISKRIARIRVELEEGCFDE